MKKTVTCILVALGLGSLAFAQTMIGGSERLSLDTTPGDLTLDSGSYADTQVDLRLSTVWDGAEQGVLTVNGIERARLGASAEQTFALPVKANVATDYVCEWRAGDAVYSLTIHTTGARKTASSGSLSLDTLTGPRPIPAKGAARIRFSPDWETTADGAVATVSLNGAEVTRAAEAGEYEWTPPAQKGVYTFTHAVTVSGSPVGEVLTATFADAPGEWKFEDEKKIPAVSLTDGWSSEFQTTKSLCEALHVPLLLVWANPGCSQCEKLWTACQSQTFQDWSCTFGGALVWVWGTGTADAREAKAFAKNSSGEFPYVCVYWPKEDGSAVYERFTGRSGRMPVRADTLEAELIASYEHYVGDYGSGSGCYYRFDDYVGEYDGQSHTVGFRPLEPAPSVVVARYAEHLNGPYQETLAYSSAGSHNVWVELTSPGYASVTGLAKVVISPRSLETSASVEVDRLEFSSGDEPMHPQVVSAVDTSLGRNLVENVDYRVSYSEWGASGTLSVTGMGNYTGELTFAYWFMPGSVSGVSATTLMAGEIDVTWESDDHAERYVVYRALRNRFERAEEVAVTTKPLFKDLTAQPGATYYYWVKAVNDHGEGAVAAEGVMGACVAPVEITTSKDLLATEMEEVDLALEATGGTTPYAWRLADPYWESESCPSAFEEKGVAQGWRADDDSWRYELPFVFPVFGRKAHEVMVGDNGTLYVVTASGGCDDSQGLEIDACGADLLASAPDDDIFIDQGEDQVTFRWRRHYYDDEESVANFSITLKATGEIDLHYGEGNALNGWATINYDELNQEFEDAGDPATSLRIVPIGCSLPEGVKLTEDGRLVGSPRESGTFAFGVEAESANGGSTVRSFTLTVRPNENRPPVLESVQPTTGRIKMLRGQTRTFSVVASDPGQSSTSRLTYEWFVNGEKQPCTGADFVFDPSAFAQGAWDDSFSVICRVGDDLWSGEAAVSQFWNVLVGSEIWVGGDEAEGADGSEGNPYGSLEEAMGSAHSGDVITLKPGKYWLDWIRPDVTIRAAGSHEETVVICDWLEGEYSEGVCEERIERAVLSGVTVKVGHFLSGVACEHSLIDGGRTASLDDDEDSVVYDCNLTDCVVTGFRDGVRSSRLSFCTVAKNCVRSAAVRHCSVSDSIIAENYLKDGTLANVGAREADEGEDGWDDGWRAESFVRTCVWPLQDGEGNIEADPMFVDSYWGDLRLRKGSPARGMGAQFVGQDVEGFVVSVRTTGSGDVLPHTTVVPAGGAVTLEVEETSPCEALFVNGNQVEARGPLTLSNVQEDTLVTAEFAYSLVTGGDVQWNTVGRKLCAGDLEIGEEAWVEMRVEGPGLVKFQWSINDSSADYQYSSGCYRYDLWQVSVDDEWPGDEDVWINVNGADWQDSEIAVYGEGEHVIRWTFVREEDRYNGFAVGDISWRPAPEHVTVKLDPTLGEVEPGQVELTPGGTYGSLPVPSRDGVEFVGWSVDRWDPELVSEDDRVPLKNTTLYAWWNPTKEQVIDPEGTLSSLAFGEGWEGHGNDPWTVRMDYRTLDWGTDTREWYEELSYQSYFGAPTTQTVFRATVEGVGTLELAGLRSYSCIVKILVDGEEMPPRNYYQKGTSFKFLTAGTHEFRVDIACGEDDDTWADFSLGAMHWTAAKSRLAVAFDAMGGVASAAAKSCRTGQSYGQLPTVEPRPGYEFLGWFTSPDGGELKTADDLVDFEATTLYAHWRTTLAEALNNKGLTFVTSGPTGWEGFSGETHDGLSAAASGWLEWNETNTLATTVSGKGVLSFWWKVARTPAVDLGLTLDVDGAQMELPTMIRHTSTNANGWIRFVLTLTNDCVHTVAWKAAIDSEAYNASLEWREPETVRERVARMRKDGWYGPVPDPGAWLDEVSWQSNAEQTDVVLWGYSAWQVHRNLPGKADPMMAWCNQRIASDPCDYEAYVRRAITRIKALSESVAFRSLLSRYGFGLADDFTAVSGEFNAETAPVTNEAVDELAAEVLPALAAISADLEVIPVDWTGSVALPASDYPVDEDIYVDYADVVMAKSLAKGMMALVHVFQAYDLTLDNQNLKAEFDARMAELQDGGKSPLLTVEALLQAHPSCVGSIRSQASLDLAKEELRSALALYVTFDTVLNGRTSGRMHFFERDPQHAEQWQTTVNSAELASAALDGTVTVEGENYACFKKFAAYTNETVRASLKPFFDGKGLRTLVPPFEGDLPVLSSIPDITFAGTFPDWTMQNRMDWLKRMRGVWYDGTPAPIILAPDSFEGPFAEVTLDEKMPGATVLYTLDGSDPAENGKAYAAPFRVCDTTTIRAVAYSGQSGFSEEVTTRIEKAFGVGDAIGSFDGELELGSESPWTIDTTVTHEAGAASMKSGRICSSEDYPARNYSTLAATYRGKGALSFWWKVSCESDGITQSAEFDFLGVYVDGELVRAIDGKTDWSRVEIELSGEAEHRIEWRYSKDDMDEGDIGDDCGWVDDVVWMAESPAGDLTGATQSTSPQIPYAWLDRHGLGPRNAKGGYTFEQAAKLASPKGKCDGDGKPLSVLDEYVAGTDPQDKDDTFHAVLEFEDGKPVIKWHPKLLPEDEALRIYRTFGRESLEAGKWAELPEGKTDGFRFFKTSVEWK